MLPVLMLCRHRQRHYNAVHNTAEKVKLPFPKESRAGSQLRKNREALEKEEKENATKEEEEEQKGQSARSRRFSSRHMGRFSASRPVTNSLARRSHNSNLD